LEIPLGSSSQEIKECVWLSAPAEMFPFDAVKSSSNINVIRNQSANHDPNYTPKDEVCPLIPSPDRQANQGANYLEAASEDPGQLELAEDGNQSQDSVNMWAEIGLYNWAGRQIRSPVTERMWRALVTEKKKRIIMQALTVRVKNFTDLQVD